MCLSFVRIHVWKRSNATSRESSRMWWWDVRARPCVALGPTPLTAAVSPLTGAIPVTTATTLFALVPHPPRQVSEDVIPGYVCRRVFVCACACVFVVAWGLLFCSMILGWRPSKYRSKEADSVWKSLFYIALVTFYIAFCVSMCLRVCVCLYRCVFFLFFCVCICV